MHLIWMRNELRLKVVGVTWPEARNGVPNPFFIHEFDFHPRVQPVSDSPTAPDSPTGNIKIREALTLSRMSEKVFTGTFPPL